MAYFNLKCGEDLHCVGVLAVYRFSFALASFHFLLAIILSYKFNLAKVIQSGFWIIKFPVYCLFVFIAFLIPNGFFQFIATWIYLPGAFIFVMIQVLLLISFAYDVAESLLESWEQTDDKKWLILLLSLTFGSLIATMIITVLLYVWYGSPECQLNQFFISFNLVLCFIVVIASCNHLVQEANPKSGMAQASMVAVYATYLVSSAIANAPTSNPKCNPDLGKTQTSTIVIGSILTFLALAYSTTSAASSTEKPLNSEHIPLIGAEIESGTTTQAEEDDYSYGFFHFVFGVASMYIAMLLTDWNSVESIGGVLVISKSMASVWVKVVSSWIVLLLYFWSLIAPLVLEDRDFY